MAVFTISVMAAALAGRYLAAQGSGSGNRYLAMTGA